MRKNADGIMGLAVAGFGWVLANPAEGLSVLLTGFSICLILIRLRKEWRHRND